MSESSGAIGVLFAGDTTPREQIDPYYQEETDLATINQCCNYKTYTHRIYLEGDFSNAFDYMEAGDEYNALSNNCSQKSLRILSKCDTEHSKMLKTASKKLLPSRAYLHIKLVIAGKSCVKSLES